jgi:hypothetical protein
MWSLSAGPHLPDHLFLSRPAKSDQPKAAWFMLSGFFIFFLFRIFRG